MKVSLGEVYDLSEASHWRLYQQSFDRKAYYKGRERKINSNQVVIEALNRSIGRREEKIVVSLLHGLFIHSFSLSNK